MTRHVLACGSEYFWCSNEHANGWAVLLGLATIAGGVIILMIVALVMAQFRR